MRVLLTTVALAVSAALMLPATAFAHASIESTTPASGERVERPPRAVVLGFDDPVVVISGAVRVFAADGAIVSKAARLSPDRRVVRVPLSALRRGAYTVRWRVLSPSDGHVVSGVFTFGVGVPAPLVTEGYGSSGPTRGEHLVRWLYFMALALTVGGVSFRLLVLPRAVPEALERRFFLLAGAGAVATLELGLLTFLLRAEDALQLGFARFLYGDLSPIAATRAGAAFVAMTLAFALVASLLLLAFLTGRRLPLWLALALGLAAASGLSLSGHQASEANSSMLSELADWLHLSAALLWLGGLAQLALVFAYAPPLRRETFLRFSRLATVLVATVVGAGIYLAILRLQTPSDLWRESYGLILLLKLALAAAALGWGAAHRLLVRPRLTRSPSSTLLSRTGRSLLGEASVVAAVLLVAAVLVDSRPPSQAGSDAPAPPAAPVRSAR